MQSSNANYIHAKNFIKAIKVNPTELERHRECAFHSLLVTLLKLEYKGYREFVICELARQKGEQLLSAKRIKTVERMKNPHLPKFNGKRYVPDPYMLPLEELIYWCEMSTRCVYLREEAIVRYLELYDELMPELLRKAEEIKESDMVVKTA